MDNVKYNPFYSRYTDIKPSFDCPVIKELENFNCKSKIYPDGSSNSCIHSVDVFGGDPYKYSRHASTDENLRREFFRKHAYEEQNSQNILDVLSGNTSFTQIQNNNCLYELGFISASECVDRNTKLRNIEKCFESSSLNPCVFDNNYTPRERDDVLKKSKDRIFDYILSNSWSWFFTGTINPKKMDSSKPKECLKPIQNWLKNMVKRYDIAYICIFERHKKGNIHMHGLILESPDKPLRVVDSGTSMYYGFSKPMRDRTARKRGLDPKKGRPVYNLRTWKFGFTTCIRTYGEPQSLAHYVTKYITKDSKKIFGKYYWHSRNLDKPKIVYSNVDFDSINAAVYHGFKYVWNEPQKQIGDLSDKIS